MQIFIIALTFLLATIKTPLIWYLYTLFLPGYCILSLTSLKTKEKALFALPFSLFLVHWPYFLITRSGIGLPSYYFTIIPAICLIIYITKTNNIQNILTNTKIKFDGRIKKETLYTLILSTILLISFYYSFQAFISPETYTPFQNGMSPGVPRTLGAKYIAETEVLKENILNGRGATGWSDEWFNGMHTLTSYPPLSYLILAVNSLNHETWKTHNTNVYFFSFLFAIYLYYLLTYLKINKHIALTISIISATLPPLIQVNNVLKTSIDFTFLPLILYSLLLLLNNPNKTNIVISAVTFTMFVMNFYLTTFILLYSLIIFIIYYTYKSKKKIQTLKCLAKAGILSFLIGGIWFIPFIYDTFTESFSMLSYTEGAWHSPLQSADKITDYMTRATNPNDIPFDIHSFTTLSPQFFYMGLIASIIILILSFTKRQKDKNYRISIIPLTLLIYIYIQLTPLREILPMYSAIYGKIYHYFPLILLFAISISQTIELISKNNKHTRIAAIIILIIIFIPVFQYSHNMGIFLSEGSVVNEKNLEWLNRPLEQIGKGGSFILFGLYGPGYIPGITMYTDIQAFSGYGVEAHTTMQSYEKRIVPFQEATMDNLLTDKASYAYNIFKQSNVRVLIFQRCSQTNTGQNIINPNSVGEKAYQTLIKDPRFKIITNESCIALMTTTEPKKAEKIFLTEMLVENPELDHSKNIKYATTHVHLDEMLNNREKAIISLLETPAGEHLHYTAKEFAFPKEKYTNIIINRTATREEITTYLKNNSTIIYFKNDININHPNFHQYKEYPKNSTELNEILKKARFIDTEVEFKQDNTNYELNAEGFVIVKETYFRKWHSNADIKESYLGFIILDTKGPTKLWYAPTNIDYLGSLLTLIGIIITLLIIFNQRQTKNEKEIVDNNEQEKTQKERRKKNPKKRRKHKHQ